MLTAQKGWQLWRAKNTPKKKAKAVEHVFLQGSEGKNKEKEGGRGG